jgi:hypothetical protein
MSKIKTFQTTLKYWQEQLEVADNQERIDHCKKMVARYEKKVMKPQDYAGY